MQLAVNAPWLIAFLLVLARALAWLLMISPFSSRATMPTVVTVGVAAGLAIMIAPEIGTAGLPHTTAGVLGSLVLQLMTGLALGFVVQLLLSAVAAAGTFLDMAGGLNLPPSLNPLNGEQTALLGVFYSQVTLFLLFTSNGYLVMFEGFVHSFAGPGFTLAASKTVAAVLVTDLGVFFTSAVEIAGPLLVVLFAAQVVLALLSKAAPQTNVWILGFPFQIFLVLLLVGLTVTGVPNDVASLLTRGVGDGAHLFGALAVPGVR